jgi:hypothetical protein
MIKIPQINRDSSHNNHRGSFSECSTDQPFLLDLTKSFGRMHSDEACSPLSPHDLKKSIARALHEKPAAPPLPINLNMGLPRSTGGGPCYIWRSKRGALHRN